MNRWMTRGLSTLLVLGITSTAMAQDPAKPATDPAKPADNNQMTPEQIKLNNEVSILLRSEKPDLDLALKKINEAISKGKRIDVLLLTLARVHQLRDECPTSKKILNEIDLAPHDPRVPKKNVSELKNEYVRQMRSRCSATLTVVCKQPDVKLSVNDKPLICGQKTRFKPGTYQIDAVRGKQKYSFSKNLDEGARHYNHTFVMPEQQKSVNKTIIIKEKDPGFGYTRTTVAAITTLVLGSGLTIWNQVSKRQGDDAYEKYTNSTTISEAEGHKEDVQNYDQTNLITGYSAIGVWSVGLLTTGLMFYLDRQSIQERKAKSSITTNPKVSFAPTRDGFQAGVTLQF